MSFGIETITDEELRDDLIAIAASGRGRETVCDMIATAVRLAALSMMSEAEVSCEFLENMLAWADARQDSRSAAGLRSLLATARRLVETQRAGRA